MLTRIIVKKIWPEHEKIWPERGVLKAFANKPGGGGRGGDGLFPGAIDIAVVPADGCAVGSSVMGVSALGHQIGIAQLSPEPFGIFAACPFRDRHQQGCALWCVWIFDCLG